MPRNVTFRAAATQTFGKRLPACWARHARVGEPRSAFLGFGAPCWRFRRSSNAGDFGFDAWGMEAEMARWRR